MRLFFLIFLFLVLLSACNIRKAINPTDREKYERDFKGPDSLMTMWKQSYERALEDQSLPVELPLVVTARLHEFTHMAFGYQFLVNSGQELVVELDRQGDTTQFFVELFRSRRQDGAYKMLEALDNPARMLRATMENTDTVRLVVQPSIYNKSVFRLRIYLQPAYLFPVAGKGNAAISSFWGADRDGGSRLHEGVDIFAPRGTPLLAVADGRITSTGERGLGGKQVWLRDDIFGRHVYYAHLDSIHARDGQKVNRGDTVGFVGNTGNAITTVPHLHFGIYGNGGATDPLLYIKQLPVPAFGDTVLKTTAITRNNKNELRSSPAAKSTLLYTVPKNDTIQILGKTSSWYHVQFGETQGFMQQATLKVNL